MTLIFNSQNLKYKEEPWLTPELTAQIIEKNNALKKS